jgi:hypothetical protein
MRRMIRPMRHILACSTSETTKPSATTANAQDSDRNEPWPTFTLYRPD